ncbi:PspC domain-containing protein [Microbacterium sp. ASV49]|uniref:PspC domain-containing protein n=1 Tax=Microbacterium candidum TaxID=3041922 RepID=A0ABT7MX56_9MICO|nr:PspC domain-containing protein [Microbacterium sp. ASV49]MDL9979032.1 PspC domain-containing protein [Microbacterium sp. ASV49]
MTDTTTQPVTDPGPPPPRPAGVPQPDSRFFAWIRGFGVVRSQGWLGGVCAGIAARLGVDPVIIRGVFVVAALVGFPALLVYAIAWALLPATDGRIVLQRLARGGFDPAIIAIVIMAVIAMVPVVPWGWSTVFGLQPIGSFSGSVSGLFGLFFSTLFWVAVGVLVLWLVLRTRHGSRVEAAPRRASADVASPSPSEGGWDAAAAPFGSAAAAASGIAPPVPASAAVGDEVSAWREQHEQWREQHDAWRRQQADADQAARALARQENEAKGRAFALEAQARADERRRANPRASAGAVFAVLGAAIVGGAGAALAMLASGTITALCAGLLVAAVISAIGMVVAGALRRRSGILALLTGATLILGLIVMPFTTSSQLLWPSADISADTRPMAYAQPFGYTNIQLLSFGTGDETAGTISLRKTYGVTSIQVPPGVRLVLDAELQNGPVAYSRIDMENGELVNSSSIPAATTDANGNTYHWEFTNPAADHPGVTTQHVRIQQVTGPVDIMITVDKASTGAAQ